ncbi:MAG: response regulator [Bacteroidota bacterium]|nr:response regulator [Bacteroidota bacterium]
MKMGEFTPNSDPQQRIFELEAEVKKLEKELSKAQEKNQNFDKLRSAFLANMSHAVRTPMNAIIGFSELIGMENISMAKKIEFIRIINEKGHQLLALIDDIIEAAKLEGGRVEFVVGPIIIDEFLNDIFSSTLLKKLKAGKDFVELILEKNSQEEYGQIQADPGRLQQVINNLLSFSIQSTSKGSIKFGYTIKDPKVIEFFVKDTGTGLNKDDQKLVFNYFWQFEDVFYQRLTGNGLELTIAGKLVEMMGGKIWVNSEPDTGTEFYFTLPIIRPSRAGRMSGLRGTEKNINEKTEPVWKNKVILVVEDDPINFQFIEALLEKTQVRILHAENGNQALELILSINKVDLILMDIKLPEKSGYEVTREIKNIRKEIPIIALTAFAVNEIRNKCLSAGCEDVISKPVEIEPFLKIVNQYLEDK